MAAKKRTDGKAKGSTNANAKALEEAGFENIGAGQIFKWEEVGTKLLGRLLKIKSGSFGPLLVIHTDDGPVVAGCPTILATRLETVVPGDTVFIEYLGMVVQKSGREAKEFTVMVKRASVTS